MASTARDTYREAVKWMVESLGCVCPPAPPETSDISGHPAPGSLLGRMRASAIASLAKAVASAVTFDSEATTVSFREYVRSYTWPISMLSIGILVLLVGIPIVCIMSCSKKCRQCCTSGKMLKGPTQGALTARRITAALFFLTCVGAIISTIVGLVYALQVSHGVDEVLCCANGTLVSSLVGPVRTWGTVLSGPEPNTTGIHYLLEEAWEVSDSFSPGGQDISNSPTVRNAATALVQAMGDELTTRSNILKGMVTNPTVPAGTGSTLSKFGHQALGAAPVTKLVDQGMADWAAISEKISVRLAAAIKAGVTTLAEAVRDAVAGVGSMADTIASGIVLVRRYAELAFQYANATDTPGITMGIYAAVTIVALLLVMLMGVLVVMKPETQRGVCPWSILWYTLMFLGVLAFVTGGAFGIASFILSDASVLLASVTSTDPDRNFVNTVLGPVPLASVITQCFADKARFDVPPVIENAINSLKDVIGQIKIPSTVDLSFSGSASIGGLVTDATKVAHLVTPVAPTTFPSPWNTAVAKANPNSLLTGLQSSTVNLGTTSVFGLTTLEARIPPYAITALYTNGIIPTTATAIPDLANPTDALRAQVIGTAAPGSLQARATASGRTLAQVEDEYYGDVTMAYVKSQLRSPSKLAFQCPNTSPSAAVGAVQTCTYDDWATAVITAVTRYGQTISNLPTSTTTAVRNTATNAGEMFANKLQGIVDQFEMIDCAGMSVGIRQLGARVYLSVAYPLFAAGRALVATGFLLVIAVYLAMALQSSSGPADPPPCHKHSGSSASMAKHGSGAQSAPKSSHPAAPQSVEMTQSPPAPSSPPATAASAAPEASAPVGESGAGVTQYDPALMGFVN